ncbi:hypothetical protein AALA22_11375 [Anaerovoracaceae bacterium 41-7]
MVRTVSDLEGYKYKVIHDSGDVTYFNELKISDSLSEIMSRCWDSLSDEVKREINNRKRN